MTQLIDNLCDHAQDVLDKAATKYKNYLNQGKLLKCKEQMDVVYRLVDQLELAEAQAESDEDMERLSQVEDLIKSTMEKFLGITDETFSNDEPELVTVVNDQNPGRNDPCSCGSGLKFKKCCGA
jgi:uncharacterized protein YecA (UPF0149 family)